MSYFINATHIFSQDDGYMLMVGFSDDKFEPSKFVIIQKSYEYDEQDRQMGMDQIHIQVDDESRSIYGGIKLITFCGSTLQIVLDNKARSALQVDGDIEICVDVNQDGFHEVISNLKNMAKSNGITFEDSRINI